MDPTNDDLPPNDNNENNNEVAWNNECQNSADFSDTSNVVKNIYIHRNGDIYSASRRFVYNKKKLRTWNSFLEDLTGTLNPRTGHIRSIHTPQTGTEIQNFGDIQPNRNYVALASGEKLQMIGYLNLMREQEAAKRRRNYYPPSQRASEVSSSSAARSVQKRVQVSGRIKYEMLKRGKTIHVFRNGDKFTRAITILLRHFELRNMDLVLTAIEEKVVLPTIQPIRRLLTMDGELVFSPMELEDNRFYVVAGNEPFVTCPYGQSLPNIVFETKKQSKNRNSTDTPRPSKPKEKTRAHSNDTILNKTSNHIENNQHESEDKAENPSEEIAQEELKEKPIESNNETKDPTVMESVPEPTVEPSKVEYDEGPSTNAIVNDKELQEQPTPQTTSDEPEPKIEEQPTTQTVSNETESKTTAQEQCPWEQDFQEPAPNTNEE